MLERMMHKKWAVQYSVLSTVIRDKHRLWEQQGGQLSRLGESRRLPGGGM